MKTVIILVLGCAAVLAQVDNFEANESDLQNIGIGDDFEGLISSGENDDNDEVFTQAALSILSTGRPNCFHRENWGHRFRHNWYVSQFWECNRLQTDLNTCAIPRIYQPSLERCVWAWNWKWEPILRKEPKTTLPPGTTVSTTDASITTTEITTVLPPRESRCDAPDCDGELSGLLQPSHDPSQFFRCTILGRHVVLTCPTPLLFNYSRQLCLPADQHVNSC